MSIGGADLGEAKNKNYLNYLTNYKRMNPPAWLMHFLVYVGAVYRH